MSGVNLGLANDTTNVLRGTAALVNTMAGSVPGDTDVDRLTSVAELDAFVAAWRWTGSRTHDQAELDAVRDLRPQLRSWWSLDEAGLVMAVNATLANAQAVPQLVDHDGWGWHLHASQPSAPMATRMAVEAAMAFVDLIRLSELDRRGICAAQDCDDVVVDLSKNRSRRYCEGTCGNRAAVATYRQRRRAVKRRNGFGQPG
ncbi:MAG: CGNR zinc finger domain-containing protein [Dermatophilaceae bacterium]